MDTAGYNKILDTFTLLGPCRPPGKVRHPLQRSTTLEAAKVGEHQPGTLPLVVLGKFASVNNV